MEPLGTALLVALVIALTEVIRLALKMNKDWIPLTAVILSVIVSLIMRWGEYSSFAFIQALVIGLAACGMWDLGGYTFSGIKSLFVKK